ncbi:hypothetical protein T484DRAFT_1797215 [Baffinella frigidus]|nr:hypothetical protein T484DRAFT_1797215 [Cryptophyta sp. CCMP2293]
MGEQLRLPDLGLHDLREFVLHHLPAISIARFSAVSQALRRELTAPETVHWVARAKKEDLFLHPDRISTLEHLHLASSKPRAWVVHFEHLTSSKPRARVVHFEFACLSIEEVPADARGMLEEAAAFACLSIEEVPAEARGMMEEAVALLRRHPDALRVRVDGHTQQGAPEPIATMLSQQRAELVAHSLAYHYQKRAELVAHCLAYHYQVARDSIDVAWHSSRSPIDNIVARDSIDVAWHSSRQPIDNIVLGDEDEDASRNRF